MEMTVPFRRPYWVSTILLVLALCLNLPLELRTTNWSPGVVATDAGVARVAVVAVGDNEEREGVKMMRVMMT